MYFDIIPNQYDTKRIPENRNTYENITEYGLDNLYPQRIEQVFLLSSIAKSCVQVLAEFIRGDGFADEKGGNDPINDLGETPNDILNSIAYDLAVFNGYGLHVNSSALGLPKSLEHIPFKFIRLGLTAQNGRVRDVKVSNNWEGMDEKLPTPSIINPKRYRLFNSSEAAQEALTTGQGMVLYKTLKKNEYPLSSIDSIIEDCCANHELSKFQLGSINNGFLSMSLFKYPSDNIDEDEVKKITKKLNQFRGSSNANSIMVVAVPEDSENTSAMIEQIPANNNDTLFQVTTENVKDSIVESYGIPKSLIARTPSGSFITATQIADDYTFMNLKTKDIRNDISRQFKKLGFDFGDIIPNQFEDSTMLDTKPENNANTEGPVINVTPDATGVPRTE